MRHLSLILFMLLITLANLVFAADWHGNHHQGEETVTFEGHVSAPEHTDHTGHQAESCTQTHSCHAHSHIFSLHNLYGLLPPGDNHHGLSIATPMPQQQHATPPLPPPIA